MKKRIVYSVLVSLAFVLTSCGTPEKKKTAETKTAEANESSQIRIDTPYLPKSGSIKVSGENVAIGDIDFSIKKVSKLDGVNGTKLAFIQYKVTNNTQQKNRPSEFWYRYVRVTQDSNIPLTVGALPFEEKENKNGKLLKKANRFLEKEQTTDGAVLYVLENDSDVKITYLDTDYQEISSQNYSLD